LPPLAPPSLFTVALPLPAAEAPPPLQLPSPFAPPPPSSPPLSSADVGTVVVVDVDRFIPRAAAAVKTAGGCVTSESLSSSEAAAVVIMTKFEVVAEAVADT
jgi:hypothetical protein